MHLNQMTKKPTMAKSLIGNGGRDRVRTCDPYDVNVGDSAETAEYCGFCEPPKVVSGLMFHLRSRSLVQLGQAHATSFAFPLHSLGRG